MQYNEDDIKHLFEAPIRSERFEVDATAKQFAKEIFEDYFEAMWYWQERFEDKYAEMTPEEAEAVNQELGNLQARAMRVLGLSTAIKQLKEKKEGPKKDSDEMEEMKAKLNSKTTPAKREVQHGRSIWHIKDIAAHGKKYNFDLYKTRNNKWNVKNGLSYEKPFKTKKELIRALSFYLTKSK